MTPSEYCQEKAAKSGSSFYYAFLFLPPDRRLAITALYAFCREVDDVVDECTDASIARIKLAWWRTQVEAMYQDKAEHPVTQALTPWLKPFHITRERLLAIIDGMEMDLDQTRYLDWPALEKYCWHVAGVVGELSAGIFGKQSPEILKYASKLGIAFQLTNIIRDVGDDARRGRIYIPISDLQKFEVRAADILNSQYSSSTRLYRLANTPCLIGHLVLVKSGYQPCRMSAHPCQSTPATKKARCQNQKRCLTLFRNRQCKQWSLFHL